MLIHSEQESIFMLLAHRIWGGSSAGPDDKEKIVLLHGMGGTGVLWRPVAASLEDRYTILAVDQRGHGASQEPANSYAPEDFGRDVLETIETLSFHPAWLVGHSMGVRTACAAAHLNPSRIRGLILVDLGLSGPAGGGLGDDLARFLTRLPLTFPSRAAAREFMDRECPDPSMAQYLMAVSVALPDGRQGFPFDKEALIRTLEAVRDTSVREWLRELGTRGMPILLLRGAESRVWSREDYLREMRAFADRPSVEFQEVPGTGHGLPFEKRVEFVARMSEFMERHREKR